MKYTTKLDMYRLSACKALFLLRSKRDEAFTPRASITAFIRTSSFGQMSGQYVKPKYMYSQLPLKSLSVTYCMKEEDLKMKIKWFPGHGNATPALSHVHMRREEPTKDSIFGQRRVCQDSACHPLLIRKREKRPKENLTYPATVCFGGLLTRKAVNFPFRSTYTHTMEKNSLFLALIP